MKALVPDQTNDLPGNASPGAETSEDTSVPATILVVEDEREILEPLAHSIERAGFRVLVAEDGLAACRMIGTHEPDLIMLDILLPDLNGWEVCRMLRQHPVPQVAKTPVIMLTALSSQRDKLRGLELGADIYLPKPYSIREILLYAANLTQRHQQTRKLEQRLKQISQREMESASFNRLLFHELRNRLLVLNGYAELLSNGEPAEVCVDAINRSSAYLSNLAEDILLIRHIKDSQVSLPREDLHLCDILDHMIQIYAPQADQRATRLKLLVDPESPRVRLNRPALKITLSTLIDNALKYGPEGQTVTIHCQQTRQQLDLLVVDQGPGVAAMDLEKVFDPFYRAESTRQHVSGSGLGLHGVQVLSRALGGDVTIETDNGKHCCFRVQLSLPSPEM